VRGTWRISLTGERVRGMKLRTAISVCSMTDLRRDRTAPQMPPAVVRLSLSLAEDDSSELCSWEVRSYASTLDVAELADFCCGG
jgi:hypothetical protein